MSALRSYTPIRRVRYVSQVPRHVVHGTGTPCEFTMSLLLKIEFLAAEAARHGERLRDNQFSITHSNHRLIRTADSPLALLSLFAAEFRQPTPEYVLRLKDSPFSHHYRAHSDFTCTLQSSPSL